MEIREIKPFQSNYFIAFVDGEYCWSKGSGGMDAARKAEDKWGVKVKKYRIPGLEKVWSICG